MNSITDSDQEKHQDSFSKHQEQKQLRKYQLDISLLCFQRSMVEINNQLITTKDPVVIGWLTSDYVKCQPFLRNKAKYVRNARYSVDVAGIFDFSIILSAQNRSGLTFGILYSFTQLLYMWLDLV